ncbi:MAG: ice-binding family protein [Candidatus Dormibacteria bacterium]
MKRLTVPKDARAFVVVTAVLSAMLAVAIPALATTGTAPGLGVATSFAVLAGSAVTNTGPSVISGDVGVSPGSAITGFSGPPNGTVINGSIHQTDATAAQAEADLTTAYNNAAGQKSCTDETGKVLGQDIGTAANPLLPGVYCFTSSAQLTGALHLSTSGVYIFQVVSTLTTASDSSVVLESGASACDVYWQVGSSATLGTRTNFAGTIMALTDISVLDAVVIQGRALARNGQVSLINDKITTPSCGAAASGTTLTSSANPTVVGQSVTFTATVAGGAGGTVTFYDMNTPLGSATVDSAGHATLTTSALGSGNHTITAVFSGTPGRLPSESPPLTQTVTSVPGLPQSGSGGAASPGGMPRSILAMALATLLAAAGISLWRRQVSVP